MEKLILTIFGHNLQKFCDLLISQKEPIKLQKLVTYLEVVMQVSIMVIFGHKFIAQIYSKNSNKKEF